MAEDLPAVRVFSDQGVSLRIAHVPGFFYARPEGRKGTVWSGLQIVRRLCRPKAAQFLRTAQTRGFYADKAPEARGGIFDHKAADAAAIRPPGIGPHSGKAADGVIQLHLGQQKLRLLTDKVQTLPAYRKVGAVFPLGGAQQQAALHRGHGVNALAPVLRLVLDDVGGCIFRGPVQHQIVPGVGRDPYRGRRQQRVHPVGGKPRAVEYAAAEKALPFGLQDIAALRWADVHHFGVEKELRAVGRRVFPGGDPQRPGVYGACTRGIKGHGHFLRQPRLQLPGLDAAEKPQAGNAVCLSLFKFSLQDPVSLFPQTDHQRAAAGKGNVQLPAEPVKAGIGPDGHLRFQRPRLVVAAGVDNGRIGPGNAGADILPGLKQRHRQFPAPQVPGGKAAQKPAADHRSVISPHVRIR